MIVLITKIKQIKKLKVIDVLTYLHKIVPIFRTCEVKVWPGMGAKRESVRGNTWLIYSLVIRYFTPKGTPSGVLGSFNFSLSSKWWELFPATITDLSVYWKVSLEKNWEFCRPTQHFDTFDDKIFSQYNNVKKMCRSPMTKKFFEKVVDPQWHAYSYLESVYKAYPNAFQCLLT